MNTSIYAYLTQYYSDMNEENRAIIKFLEFVPFKAETALDFSFGGSLMIAAQLSKTVPSIDLSDINELALKAMFSFKRGKGFNWKPIFDELQVTPAQVAKVLNKSYVARFPASLPKKYDLITCFFALETASDSWKSFQLYYTSLLKSLNPQGWLIIGVVTQQYKIINGANHEQDPLYVTEEVFLDHITPDIFQKITACADWGYKGMLFSAQQNNSLP